MNTKVCAVIALVIMTLIASAQAIDVSLTSDTVVGNILYENVPLYSLICMLVLAITFLI